MGVNKSVCPSKISVSYICLYLVITVQNKIIIKANKSFENETKWKLHKETKIIFRRIESRLI
jgi:hypothetical protein